jgi:cephalosporin-C deacetylase-like acetyl esterase
MNAAPAMDPTARHEAVIAYLKRTAAELTSRSLSEIQSLADWEQQRPALLQELRYMLGLEPLPERTPLQAETTGVLEYPVYRIEKIVLQSMPGLYVTGNLYIPHNASEPRPTILYVCGHSPDPLGAKFHYQDRALWFVTHGYVCLVLDTLEFGEVAGIHHGLHDLNMWHWLSLGYTPIGAEVWNAVRALDYLETRPEVDRQRIGMNGISGGGVATWYTAAVDTRVSAAVPVCSTFTFGSQAEHWCASGQCDCIYFYNTFLRDFPLIAALIAPRPLLICSGQRDGDFPPDGYHEVFRQAKRIYDLYAATPDGSDRIREVDENVGHEDSSLLRTETRQWMHRWLRDDQDSQEAEPPTQEVRESAKALACLSRLPMDAVNYHIHNQFVPVARPHRATSLAEWQSQHEALLKTLRQRVFRWFPAEGPPLGMEEGSLSPVSSRLYHAAFQTWDTGDDGGWGARYAKYRDVVFNSEEGVFLRAQLYKPGQTSSETPVLLYVKRAEDNFFFLDLDELLPLFGRCTVLVLRPRLTEQPISVREHAAIERTAAWTGRTIAAMQVWDILRAVEWFCQEEKQTPTSLAIYGKGEMGIQALYAGLLDERIRQVILQAPPSSHWQGPPLLNVLRVTDIPEIAAAFAPRRLTFLREIPRGFGDAQAVYGLHGASDHFGQAQSLPEALAIWKYLYTPPSST